MQLKSRRSTDALHEFTIKSIACDVRTSADFNPGSMWVCILGGKHWSMFPFYSVVAREVSPYFEVSHPCTFRILESTFCKNHYQTHMDFLASNLHVVERKKTNKRATSCVPTSSTDVLFVCPVQNGTGRHFSCVPKRLNSEGSKRGT